MARCKLCRCICSSRIRAARRCSSNDLLVRGDPIVELVIVRFLLSSDSDIERSLRKLFLQCLQILLDLRIP